MHTTFTKRVQDVVRAIPEGQTMTYKQVAVAAGNEAAARAVGMIMSKNKDLDIPCHRVVRSDGVIGNYNGLRGKTKRALLEDEGALS